MRHISVAAVRWLIQVQAGKNPVFDGGYCVLFTTESPLYCFDMRSSYGTPRLHQYGRTIPLDAHVSWVYLMFSSRAYSGHLPTRWIDGRVTEGGCHGGPCWRCETWSGASGMRPPAPSEALLQESHRVIEERIARLSSRITECASHPSGSGNGIAAI